MERKANKESMRKETCGACGLTHRKVEAQGIWYCPNAVCKGAGATWFRCSLKSYKDNRDGTHSVDKKELKWKGLLKNLRNRIFYFKGRK